MGTNTLTACSISECKNKSQTSRFVVSQHCSSLESINIVSINNKSFEIKATTMNAFSFPDGQWLGE